MAILSHPLVLLAVALCAGSAGAGTADAQEASAPALKAAFISNFAKFAEWPPDTLRPGQAFTFCVVGDKAVARALEETIKSRPSSQSLSVIQLKPDDTPQACHLLYVAGNDGKQIGHILEAVKGMAIFTVGEADRFAARGGIAQFIVENGRMRFAINQAAAQRARLSLSAKLLNLATLVKEAQ